MRSRFKDFFPVYLAKSASKKDDIKQLSEKIRDNYDTWADFGLQYSSGAAIAAILKRKAGEERKIDFISFNYTSVLGNCLNTIPDGIIETRKHGFASLKDTVEKSSTFMNEI